MTFPYLGSRVYNVADRWQMIGARGRGVPSGNAYDSASTNLMDVQKYQAPSWGGTKAVMFAYPGFDMDIYGEMLRTPNGTINARLLNRNPAQFFSTTSALAAASTAALSFGPSQGGGIKKGMLVNTGGKTPSNTYVLSNVPTLNASGAVTSYTVNLSANITSDIASGSNVGFQYDSIPASFGRQGTGLLVPDYNFLYTDPMPAAIASGQAFEARTNTVLSAPGIILQGGSNDIQVAGEACQRGTTSNDMTLSPATPTHTGSGYFGPAFVLAQMGSWKPGLLVLGDSIAFGVGDSVGDAYGRIGYVQRSLANNMAWGSLARSGAVGAISDRAFTGQFAICSVAHVTDVYIEFGRNDFTSGFSDTTVKNAIAQLAAPFKAAGIRVWVPTITPNNALSLAADAYRRAYNADLRVNGVSSYGYAGVPDVAAVVEDPNSPGQYNAGMTSDQLHPNPTGVSALVASNVIAPGMFPLYG